jgi:hypothetical protein
LVLATVTCRRLPEDDLKLDEWELSDQIIVLGFDSTSSNTGDHKGLNKQLLWLACRHHILELVIGAAYTKLFVDTKSPEVTLFKS